MGGCLISQDAELKDYLFVIYRGKWNILIFTAICTFAVIIYSILQVDVFKASATILVDTESASILNVKDVVSLGDSNYWSYQEYLKTQIQILSSRPIIEDIYEKLNLHERFDLPVKANNKYAKSYLIKRISALIQPFKELFSKDEQENDNSSKMSFEMYKRIIKPLGVEQIRDTRLIEVEYEHEDPVLAAEILNSLIEEFVSRNLKRKIQATKEAGIWLSKEVQELKRRLKYQEDMLQEFRKTYDLISADERRDIMNTKLSDLNKKLTEAQSRVAEFKKRYRDKHPTMQQAIELVETLQRLIKNTRDEAISFEEKMIQYNELTSEVNLTKQLLETVLTREKEMTITSSIHANNISIVENAIVSKKPIRPKRRRNVMIAFLFGCFTGIALVFLQETLKRNVVSSLDFTKFGMPFIGYVPYIQKSILAKNSYRDSYLLFNHKGIITEIFNHLRTSILLKAKHDDKLAKTVLFTSFLPGEGKTLITTNLAVALAKFNFKTLLLEADLRRSRIKHIFNLEPELGVSDYLLGKTEIENVIIKSPMENLDLFLNGKSPSNPSELLGGEHFKKMLDNLRMKYDIILLDSPPAFAVTDPVLLSSFVDFIIIVAKYNSTPKKLIPLIKEKFESTGVKTAGVIINQVYNAEANIADYTSSYGKEYY